MSFLSHQFADFLLGAGRLCLWLAILCVIFIPLERLFAIRRQPILRAAIWTDFGYFLLGSFLPAIMLSVPAAILAWMVHRFVPDRVHTFAAGAPFWAKSLSGIIGRPDKAF